MPNHFATAYAAIKLDRDIAAAERHRASLMMELDGATGKERTSIRAKIARMDVNLVLMHRKRGTSESDESDKSDEEDPQ
jgi:hypothetical protein